MGMIEIFFFNLWFQIEFSPCLSLITMKPEDEYMADEYDMDDLEDEMNAEFDARDIDASDSEVEDLEQLVCCLLPLSFFLFFFGCFLD